MTEELVAAVQSAIDKGAGTLQAVQAHLKDELGWNDLTFSKVKRAYTAARTQQPQLGDFIRQSPPKKQSSNRYHLLTMDDAEMLKNVVLHSVATARASIVFPVPGGPNRSTPFHGVSKPVKSSG